jgi:hypothetical protein
MNPTFPRTYQAAMKTVKAAKMKLKMCEIIERGKKNQTGNQTQNMTKYERKIATSNFGAAPSLESYGRPFLH